MSNKPPHRQLRVRQVRCDLGDGPLFRCRTPDQLLGCDIAQSTLELGWGSLLDTDGLVIAKIAQDSVSVCFERLCHWVLPVDCVCGRTSRGGDRAILGRNHTGVMI